MSGLEVLREVSLANASALEQMWDELDLTTSTRENVPIELWRAIGND